MTLDRADRESWREASRAFIGRSFPISELRARLDGPRTVDRASWANACELGWLAATVDPALGGLGAGLEAFVDLGEELARGLVGAPFAGTLLGLAVAANDPELLVSVDVEAILTGSCCVAWCVAESDAPCTIDRIQLELTCNGALELSGQKRYVLDADVADAMVVSVRDQGVLRNLWIERAAPGVTITVQKSLDLTRPIATVDFDHVAIPAARAEWSAAGSEYAVRRGLDLGVLLASADAIGAAERLMELTVDYVKQRQVFGAPLANYQAVKHKCADMLCAIDGSRVAALAAARALDAVTADDEESLAAAARALSVAKAFAGDQCSRVAGEALQLHGGIGFTWEHDLHLFLRRIKADSLLFGSAAYHRDRLGHETLANASAR